MKKCHLVNVLGEPFIITILAQYVTTADFLTMLQINGSCREVLNSSWDELRKTVPVHPRYLHISNTLIQQSFFHFLSPSIQECVTTLRALRSSVVTILPIKLSVESIPSFTEWFELIIGASQFSNLSDQVLLCQFRFSDESVEADEFGIQYSNVVSVPGGTLRLFKRAVSSLYPGNPADHPSLVVGIDLDTPKLWLCRVASISGARLDLKAGTTRADVLRVPNGSKTGTWTDLCPVAGKSAISENLYIVEYMMNFST